MTIEQTHQFVRADGQLPAISFAAWGAALPTAEKADFDAAVLKQKAILEAEKASGNLISDVGRMRVWRDGPVAPDAEWKIWFDRFLAETNTTHTIV